MEYSHPYLIFSMVSVGSIPIEKAISTERLVSYLNFYYNLKRGCHSDTPDLSLIKTNKDSENTIIIYLL
jgi:hypothetical protein